MTEEVVGRVTVLYSGYGGGGSSDRGGYGV